MRRTLVRWCEVPFILGAATKSMSSISQTQQQLIRQIMARQVLLSPTPLTPKSLLTLVRESLAAEARKPIAEPSASTASFSQYAQYLQSILKPIDTGIDNCPVESTMRLLLATDPQFRVSPGGFVCYPTLPSLLVASLNMERDTKLIPAARRILQKPQYRSSLVAKEGEWSYILSLLCLLDVEGEDPRGSVCLNDKSTVSSALAEHWMLTYDEGQLPALLRGDSSGTKNHNSRFPEELQEFIHGCEALRRWRLEAKDGYLGAALMNAPQLSQSAALPQLVNEQIGILIGSVVATPITIGRLATLIQWSFLPFAPHYRSLLHFLDLYAGGSAAMQMERHTLRRLKVRKKWGSLLSTQRVRYASQEISDGPCDEGRWPTDPISAWRVRGRGTLLQPRIMDPCRCVFLQPNQSFTEVTNNSVGERIENDIFVFGASRYIVERRLCRVLKLWWSLEGQFQQNQDRQGELRCPTITVRRLSQLCLWEHEYGPVAASKMMLQYLRCITLPISNIVRVIPPVKCGGSMVDNDGDWLVQLQENSTSGKVECRKERDYVEIEGFEEDA